KYAILHREDVLPLDPMLVREGIGRGGAKNAPHYYIVPFGFRHEFTEHGSRLARGCVLVNAFTGAFEVVNTCGKHIRYLAMEEALAIVASAMQRDTKELKNTEA